MYNDIALGNTRQKKIFGRLAQLVEHLLDVQVVSGSIPLTSTRIGEQKRCTRKKLRIFGVFSRFRGKNYKGYTVDAFG